MPFLQGKRALVVGVASKLSIASGIATAMHQQGAELAFTYQNEKLKSRVLDFAVDKWGSSEELCFPCDVGSDDDIENLAKGLSAQWDGFDILVHAVGFAPSDQLEGEYMDVTTRQGFAIAHDISSYSLTALTKALSPMQRSGGSVVTLSYLGSVLTMPNYNVMGVAKASLEASVRYLARGMGKNQQRINAISAGPIRTLAASGIKDFKSMLSYNASRTPLQRNVTIDEVGNTAAFLCSDLASGITGQVVYVDCGFNTTAMGDSD